MPIPDYKRPRVNTRELWFRDEAIARASKDLLIMNTLEDYNFLDHKWRRDNGTRDSMPQDEVDKVIADPTAYWENNIDEFIEMLFSDSYMDESPSITLEEFMPDIQDAPIEAAYVDKNTQRVIKERYKLKALETPTTSPQPAEKKRKIHGDCICLSCLLK